jgi:hypothetical protein
MQVVALWLGACSHRTPPPSTSSTPTATTQCRTCVTIGPASKVGPYLGRICRDDGTERSRMDERRPGEEIPVSATIKKDADPGVLSPRLVALGAHKLQVFDQRSLGGALRVQFTAADEATLSKIVQLDEVEWVEPPGCMNLDGG